MPKHPIEDQLRRLLPGVSRAAVDVIPRPGGIAGLQILGDSLALRREPAPERIKMPPLTLRDGGGDWDDIALVLMAAAGAKGFGTRIVVREHDGSTRLKKIQLQVQNGVADAWFDIGPPGAVMSEPERELPEFCPRCGKDEIAGDCDGELICMNCGVLERREWPVR